MNDQEMNTLSKINTCSIDELMADLQDSNPDCKIDGNHIVLRLRPDYEFEVLLDLCNTPEDILSWVVKMSCLRSITPRLIQKFILTACSHAEIDASRFLT